MNYFIRTVKVAHQILGTLLSALFVMWFLSGIVMLYKRFPNAGKISAQYQLSLPDSLPPLDSLRGVLPDSTRVWALSVEVDRDVPVFAIKTDEGMLKLSADTLLQEVPETSVSYDEAERYARRWVDADILKVDTLLDLDQWIPMSSYRSHLPVYKFVFDDSDRSYVYVSSQTGQVLQYATKSDRLWAWLGAIPHFIYILQLRQDAALWRSVVSWLSGLGALMCLVGGVMGVYAYARVWRRKRILKSPYKKGYFKWHHITGFVFGFFVFMFILSGFMSLNSLPQWMIQDKEIETVEQIAVEPPLALGHLSGDYRAILEAYPRMVKRIALKRFGTRHYYTVRLAEQEVAVEVSGQEVRPLYLTPEDIELKISSVVSTPYTVTLMTEPDHYYGAHPQRTPLPAYRVDIANEDRTTVYISATMAVVRSQTIRSRIERWIYPTFHTFKVYPLSAYPMVRKVILWVLLLGGTVVSFTGLVLGVRYIRRMFRRVFRQKK